MKIPKEVAQELSWGDKDSEHADFKVALNEIVGHSRWSINYNLVLEKDGKFFQKGYSKGATESQDESPFEYEDEEIDFKEVKPVEKVVIIYE